MSGLIERLNGVATLEEIEAEQGKLRLVMAQTQQEIDALEVYRKILVVARDGMPQRKPRGPRKAKAGQQAEVAATETAGKTLEEVVGPVHKINQDDARRKTADRCVNALGQFDGLTVAELSRALKIPYGTVQVALQIDSRFTVLNGRWYVKRKG